MCRRVTVWVQLKDRKTGKEFFYFDTHFDHIGKPDDGRPDEADRR